MKSAPALEAVDVRKAFRRDTGEIAQALAGVTLSAEYGTLTALVGPDGAGKTTLLRLATGLLSADAGELKVLGVEVAADPQQIQARIGYMPQRFGLYEDLTVQENLNLYADLHGVPWAERRVRYPQLMAMTNLGPFTKRLAGRLSGGMKQKLGLACTLIRTPELLLLDEPTVGVDPISRLELWEIILRLVHEDHQTVILSTSYLDEAERCEQVVVLHEGKVLAQGLPAEVSARAAGRTFLVTPAASQNARNLQSHLLNRPGIIDAVPEGGRVRIVGSMDAVKSAILQDKVQPVEPRFEDGFMVLLRGQGDKETRRQGDKETGRQGDKETGQGDKETGRQGDKETGQGDRETRRQGDKETGRQGDKETGQGDKDTADDGRTEGTLSSPSVSLSPCLPVSLSPCLPVSLSSSSSPVVQVHDLVRRFGAFTAVDHVSFEVQRGEIFGLLGPNGAGKTTTFRMLCGLLSASGGALQVAGVDLRQARASARQRIGYVAQKFSLYGQLSVIENLEFFASAYGLLGERKRQRIDWALRTFELAPLARLPSGQLPGGYKQRLAMAAALLHEPEILFLDEPTSGADPLARREFWQRITGMAEQGVTVIVTTHFMEEAEYCDHVVIMDSGRVLARGTPAEVRRHARPEPGKTPTMEDAFIAIVREGRQGDKETGRQGDRETRRQGDKETGRQEDKETGRQGDGSGGGGEPAKAPLLVSLSPCLPVSSASAPFAKFLRVWSLVRKEYRQIVRDPSSIAIGVVMPVLLILLFGHGLSLDVQDVPVAIVLEQPTPKALEVAARFRLSRYFEVRMFTSMKEAEDTMLARAVDGIVRIRSDFARNVEQSDAEVQIVVHGTDANKARIIQGYAQGAVGQWTAVRLAQGDPIVTGPVGIRDRMWFNEANDSHYFLVPGLVVLVMTLIGAMLTALVVAREWERGTLEALFVTPVQADEILLGKTIPYFILGMFGLALCLLSSKYFFGVPFRGSVIVLSGVSMLYLLVALGIGLLLSSATKSQFVAIQLTMLVTFLPAMMLSGFLFDLRSMPIAVRIISYCLPARYYVGLLQTIFLAGNVWTLILTNGAVLAGMAAALLVLTNRAMHKKL